MGMHRNPARTGSSFAPLRRSASKELLITTPFPARPDDAARQAELDKMKRRATALLLVAALVFLAASWYEAQFPVLGYVRATAEASLVGGLADWFAVTALFRHPLGIPIPHTAIIGRKKDQIGEALASFVQQNFLTESVVGERIAAAHVARRAGEWLADPRHAARIAY